MSFRSNCPNARILATALLCRMSGIVCLMMLALLVAVQCSAVELPPQLLSPQAHFDQSIAPLLAEKCLSCHSGAQPKAMLDLASQRGTLAGGDSGSGLHAGDLDRSLIWQRIESGEMPPDDPLNPEQQELIRRWIMAGAVWGSDPIDPFRHSTDARAGYDWWSLQPIERPVAPTIPGASTTIDALIRHQLAKQGMTPSPRAGAREIIRRLSFDFLGLPPEPMEIIRFESEFAQAPEAAVQSLVDRMLASEAYGPRWARHWLDVARFGESQGFERDKLRPNSWHYRDWVINAFQTDMPYDQFVTHQIAGDVLAIPDASSVIATGFLVAGAWDEVGQNQQSAAMKAVVRQDELEDYVGTIGQAFLGLTINCARCHDHKFDPITQKEYYRISAALAGVRHGSRDVVMQDGNTNDSQTINVYAVSPREPHETHLLARGNPMQPIEAVLPGGVAALSGVDAEFPLVNPTEDADRRRALAAWITDSRNPLFARVIANRIWHHHFGAGLVGTPNDFGFSGGLPSHPELLDYLASELIDSGFSLKSLHRLIVTSETYLQTSLGRSECESIDASNQWLWRKEPTRLEAESLRDTVLCIAGQLNPIYGGPAYQDFTTHVHNSQFYEMVDLDTADVYRRTIFRTWIRSGRNHLLDVFDCPDPSTTTPKRSITTTPLQALTLLNNSFILRMSDRFAERIQRETGMDAEHQVTRAMWLAYGRNPHPQEKALAVEFIDAHGLSAFCRVIFNSNEFIHVD